MKLSIETKLQSNFGLNLGNMFISRLKVEHYKHGVEHVEQSLDSIALQFATDSNVYYAPYTDKNGIYTVCFTDIEALAFNK